MPPPRMTGASPERPPPPPQERALRQAVQGFAGGLASLQERMLAVERCVVDEDARLLQLRQELDAERRAFDEERGRVMEVATSFKEQVVLNVGGHHYTTTLTTLQNSAEPTLFSAMFSGRHAVAPDKEGFMFIDRDGRHFHDILNFLRDGKFHYPHTNCDLKYVMELRAEAQYYGMTSLIALLDSYPHSMDTLLRAGYLTEEIWSYGSGPDEVVFSVDAACQLLGVGLCGTSGSIKVDMEVCQVEDEEQDQEEIATSYTTLWRDTQIYTRAHGKICRMMFAKPVRLEPDRTYLLSADITGDTSFSCEGCFHTVGAAGVKFTFREWDSPNGTTRDLGQFYELYIRGPRSLA